MTVYMRVMRFLVGALLLVGVSASTGFAAGQSKAGRAKPAAKVAPAAKAKKAAKPPAKPAEPEESAEAAPAASEESSKPTTEGETRVKAAGTTASEASSGKTAVKATEKEGPEGVKTYQFGAIEVEGRLKSPQLIYFLRRVRAEFEAGALGHRSFLGELSDTRNEPTFR
jgi:hypothetical protein